MDLVAVGISGERLADCLDMGAVNEALCFIALFRVGHDKHAG